ncbi:MAG: LD-carboxypeptidase [Syntrophobacteraceae bacterium]
MTLKPLRPGDHIALAAPASPFEQKDFKTACSLLEARGYKLSAGAGLSNSKGYLAGTDSERADDLVRALSNPEIAAIICVRGGYGSGRLFPWISFPGLRDKEKIFVGYSDITFLHLAFASRMNWITFHGPNLMDFVDNPEQCDKVLNALEGQTPFSWDIRDNNILREGTAKGLVVGGNLTCLTHLIGTPYLPDLRGKLLLVEDCSEALYRLDRLFMHLRLAGLLEQIGGLVLGQFKDCSDGAEIENMVMEQVKPFRFPVVTGLPFGHIPANDIIPFGIPFVLSTYDRSFRALKHPFSG